MTIINYNTHFQMLQLLCLPFVFSLLSFLSNTKFGHYTSHSCRTRSMLGVWVRKCFTRKLSVINHENFELFFSLRIYTNVLLTNAYFSFSCNTYLAQVKISEDYQKCIVQSVQTTDYVLFNLLKCDITEFVFERTRSWGQACREITREKKLNVLSPLSHKLLHERYCLLQCICKTHFCNKIF